MVYKYSWNDKICTLSNYSYLAMSRKSSSRAIFRQNVQSNAGQLLTFMVAIHPQQLKFPNCRQWSSFLNTVRCNCYWKEPTKAKCQPLFIRSALNSSVKCVWAMLATRFSNKLWQKQIVILLHNIKCLQLTTMLQSFTCNSNITTPMHLSRF